MKKSESGFTIVELLIVIVVIAILATISTVAYNGIQERARTTVLKSDLANGFEVLSAAYAIDGIYPAKLDNVQTSVARLQPSGGNTFIYMSYGGGTNYCLSAQGFRQSYFVTQDNSQPAEGDCGSVVACSSLVVGDSGPAGGVIFYKSGSTCYESAQAGWYGGSSDPTASYRCYNVDIPGAGGSAIGTGKQNTADILAAGCTGGILAAAITTGYTGGGKNDWYLPSSDELNQMYIQRDTIGGFAATFYLSSTERDSVYPISQHFGDGRRGGYGTKNDLRAVRPIRNF